jgi:hypothetical protein
MKKDDLIKDFVIKGFNNVSEPKKTDGVHEFVLKNKIDNFITEPVNLELHRWAGSLKSSQAFAYNIFSGSENVAFECHFPVFDRDAQIDVKIEDMSNQTIHLYEVKMFEVIKKEKIQFEEKYDNPCYYKYLTKENVSAFIQFKDETIRMFENQTVYGGGIKQLCSHILGIINNLDKSPNLKYKLYSFCFDNPIFEKFDSDIENYKKATSLFKIHVDKFLKKINFDSRVEYMGFLSATEYIIKNKELIGDENYEYVMKRYFFENK